MRLSIIIGFFAGIVGVLALAWTAPFLPHDRVRSETEVRTNGGRLERFTVGPSDVLSLLPATGADAAVVPAGARWYPELAPFAVEAALYRLRNASGIVVGAASRVRGVAIPEDVWWILHIPARGTLVLAGASVGTAEIGDVAGGEREFDGLVGDWQATLGEAGGWSIETTVMEPRDAPQVAGESS